METEIVIYRVSGLVFLICLPVALAFIVLPELCCRSGSAELQLVLSDLASCSLVGQPPGQARMRLPS
jgi:hypothetical protein